jgi:hypothetical protein
MLYASLSIYRLIGIMWTLFNDSISISVNSALCISAKPMILTYRLIQSLGIGLLNIYSTLVSAVGQLHSSVEE